MKKQLLHIREWSSEKISQRVFYLFIGLSMVVLVLFFLVGYNMPFIDNPDFNAPLFTDVLIILMWLMLAVAMILTLISVVRGKRLDMKQEAVVNGVPEGKIVRITWAGTLLLVILAFALSSSVPMLINGEEYADWLWLKVADTFVFSSIILLAVAIGAVIFGATRYVRKKKKTFTLAHKTK